MSAKKSKKPTTIAKKTPKAKAPVVVEKPASRTQTAKRHARYHYYRAMPDKKHWRILIWTLFLLSSVIVAAQLLYPADRALPLARLAGQSVAWHTYEELAGSITTKFSDTKLKIHSDDKHSSEKLLSQLGAEPETGAMTDNLINYPFWQRLVPLSILLHVPHVEDMSVRYTSTVFREQATSVAKELTYRPVNAELAIENGQLIARGEAVGRSVSTMAVEKAIIAVNPRMGKTTRVDVTSDEKPPVTTSDDLAEVRQRAQTALDRTVTVQVNDLAETPDKITRASWLTIGKDSEGAVELQTNAKTISAYIDTLNKKYGAPAGTTNIRLVNGVEVARDNGKNGRAIDADQLSRQLAEWVLDGKGADTIEAQFSDVAPRVMYNSRYTSDQDGLRAYVTDTARDQNANIVIRQLGGPGWSASAEGDRSTVSASTYKLFVALMLFDRMNKGEISWNDPIIGTTVSACFDRMTIASTNPCAEAWISQWGRENLNSFIRSKGFSAGTTFTHPTAVHTTANDLAKYMVGLENGSLIGGAQRDRLLTSLSSHSYRYGVPTGSSATVVYDKVGFLWSYVHDAAIVRHPRGTYVIVVMTQGRSYSTIATITREVEKILYP